MRGHEENNILSSTYVSIYEPLFQSTLNDILSKQLNAKHGNGTKFSQPGTNNLTYLLTQCAHVLYVPQSAIKFRC